MRGQKTKTYMLDLEKWVRGDDDAVVEVTPTPKGPVPVKRKDEEKSTTSEGK